jgi:putative ABC transport system permease protein
MIFYFTKILFKRTYKYLALTFFSIALGSFLFGSILSLTQSISLYFTKEGKTIIGGDIVLSAPRPIDIEDEVFKSFIDEGHIINNEYQVQAVFKNAKSTSTAVASIRAVDNNFPLYGKVETWPEPFSVKENQTAIYAEQSFLERLGVATGDNVELGDTLYTMAGSIEKEPDGVSLGTSFTPRVIMSIVDFQKSNIDLSQSRSTYKLSIKHKSEGVFNKEQINALKDYAKENKIRFDDSSDGPNNLVRGLSSVTSFIGIIFAIVLFLVVINTIANLSYILSKFKKTIAILKSFGATSTQIQFIYTILLSIIGFFAGFIGSLLGSFLANSLLPILSKYIQADILGGDTITLSLLGGIIGLLIMISASLPFFESLRKISPKYLLTRSGEISRRKILSMFLFYLPIPVVMMIFLYFISENIKLVFYSVSLLVVIFSLFMFISYIILKFIYITRDKYSFTIQSIISSLKWRGIETVIISASIMTAFLGIFIVSAVEDNIVKNLEQNISQSAPSLYIVDINKSQLERVREISGTTFKEFATIRGRLLFVNDRDITLSDNPGITREINMTYTNTLFDGDKIVSGAWHGDTGLTSSVSVDSSFAEELGGVKVGDEIEVFIQGIKVKATVTSLRETQRSGGTPFFFLVFSPDLLEDFPASYFATVSTDAEGVKNIENTLGVEFPNIIPIQTLKILDNINGILKNVILIVTLLGIPSIVLGLLLIIIMTSQSLYERKSDVLLLRAFGYEKKRIIKLFILETASVIILSSIIAYIISSLIAYVLNIYVFDFSTFVFTKIPIYISLITILIVSVFAYVISSSIVRRSLKKLLAEK